MKIRSLIKHSSKDTSYKVVARLISEFGPIIGYVDIVDYALYFRREEDFKKFSTVKEQCFEDEWLQKLLAQNNEISGKLKLDGEWKPIIWDQSGFKVTLK